MFDKAVVEVMTVFGPLGDAGYGVSANNATNVEKARDVLVRDTARELDLSEMEIRKEIDQVKSFRNMTVAHRSGADIQDMVFVETKWPEGIGRGVSFLRGEKLTSYDRLHDLCKVAGALTYSLVFPEETNS